MADQEHSRPISRPMMKCAKCRTWQTISPDATNGEVVCGGCGGELEPVDWDAHFKTLQYVPYVPPTKGK